MLDLAFIGTGGSMPLPNRYLASLMIRHEGRLILIDCGEASQISMKKISWGFKSIDAILFTHYHADHISGLPGLLLTIANSGRKEKLKLIGPPRLKKVVEGLLVIAEYLPYDIEYIELDFKNQEIKLFDFDLSICTNNHSSPCFSYSFYLKRNGKFILEKAKALNIELKYWSKLQNGETIESNGQIFTPDMVLGEERKGLKLSYTTDTRPSDNIIELARNSDLFICEGTYGDNAKIDNAIGYKHMLFSEAALMAKKADCKELILTHYSPSMSKPDEFLDNARDIFKNSHLSFDGMEKTLLYE